MDRGFTLQLPLTPPSFNAVGHTGNRWQWTRAKKNWQHMIEIALMAARVPRGQSYIEARAVLTFPTNRRRDTGNYRTILEKCLGDALVNGGWLPDDTPEHFVFTTITFVIDKGESRTDLILKEAP